MNFSFRILKTYNRALTLGSRKGILIIIVAFWVLPFWFLFTKYNRKQEAWFCLANYMNTIKKNLEERPFINYLDHSLLRSIDGKMRMNTRIKKLIYPHLTYIQHNLWFFRVPRIFYLDWLLVYRYYDGSHTFRMLQFQTSGVCLPFPALDCVGP